MTTIFLTDHHNLVRDCLRFLLETQPDFSVIGEATNGREMGDKIVQCQPDVAIYDFIMPELNGLRATQQIRQVSPRTQVIIFSLYAYRDSIIQTLEAGAKGYLLKAATGNEMIPAIRAVHSGQRYLSQKIVALTKNGHLHLPEWLEGKSLAA